MSSQSNKIILIILFLLFIFNTTVATKTSKAEVTVFILDSEVDFDFVNRRIMYEEKKVSHGSMVARVIQQEAPDAEIIPINVEKNNSIEKELYYSGLKEILEYVEEYPQKKVLVNISLAFYSYEDFHYNLIKTLADKGVCLIAAAGNDNSSEKVFPAGFNNHVVSVANASRSGKASSSNYGEHIDISAKGTVDYINNTYLPRGAGYTRIRAEGTSYAAPRVTGLLAYILLSDKSLTIKEAREIMANSTDSIYDSKYNKDMLGVGTINKEKAMMLLDPNYLIKKYSKIFLFWGAVFTLTIIIIYKLGFAILFISMLILLVVAPVLMAISFQLFPWIFQFVGTHFKIYHVIYIILITIVTQMIVYWNNKFLIINYVICFLLLPFIINFVNKDFFNSNLLPLGYTIYFIFLILSEKWKIVQIENVTGKKLIKGLNSNSQKVNEISLQKLNKYTDKYKSDLIEYINSSNNINKSIVNILLKVDDPPLSLLLDKSVYKPVIKHQIINSLKGKSDKNNISKIITEIDKSNFEKNKVICEILQKLNAKLVANIIKEKLENNSIDKYYGLKILSKISYQNICLFEFIKKIFKQNNNMWVNYQALKTMISVHPNPENIIMYLEKIAEDDSGELVKIEAKGLIKDIQRKTG
ncbi:MAG: S8 family peptidase [Halanaerobiaceae bacterium]